MRKLGVFLLLVGAQIVVAFLRDLSAYNPNDTTLLMGASVIALGLLALLWSSRWPVVTPRSRIYGTAYLVFGTFAAAFPNHRDAYEPIAGFLLVAGFVALVSAALFAACLELR